MRRNPLNKHPDSARSAATAGKAPLRSSTCILVLLFAVLMAIAFPSFVQSASLSIPANAHAKSFGAGWECDRSYRLEAGKCVAVTVPQNAYPTNRSYGKGWACSHGFIVVDGSSCEQVIVPEGGYLDPSGEGWNCLRGYIKIDDVCQEVLVPDNAYLVEDYSGSAWLCSRGYEAKEGKCIAIAVPENAFLNASSYGLPWTCERGYAEADGRCVAIELPANAHLDRSGSRWECHRNFQRSKDRCILNE